METESALRRLKMHWIRTIGWMDIDNHGRGYQKAINTDRIFEMLMEQYSAPHRLRHGCIHLIEMLNEYQYIGGEEYLIMLGIWFHDVIWEAGSETNEEESVKYMRKCMEIMGASSWEIEHVERLILATKHDKIVTDFKCKLIADLDLFCLGKDKKDFIADCNLIRKEYGRYDEHIFVKGTSDFFKKMLEVKNGSIFYTEYFIKKYEFKARRNVLSLIK